MSVIPRRLDMDHELTDLSSVGQGGMEARSKPPSLPRTLSGSFQKGGQPSQQNLIPRGLGMTFLLKLNKRCPGASW